MLIILENDVVLKRDIINILFDLFFQINKKCMDVMDDVYFDYKYNIIEWVFFCISGSMKIKDE